MINKPNLCTWPLFLIICNGCMNILSIIKLMIFWVIKGPHSVCVCGTTPRKPIAWSVFSLTTLPLLAINDISSPTLANRLFQSLRTFHSLTCRFILLSCHTLGNIFTTQLGLLASPLLDRQSHLPEWFSSWLTPTYCSLDLLSWDYCSPLHVLG